ncbi:hypothetical protein NQZ68_009931 [Dissostichus eleginoides]|nr:hypothetical protein NQZ68_009931 [Dissostichus eleginoides]
MPSVGWSGVKNAATGLWSRGNVFCGVTNHASLSGSLMDQSEFGECQENVSLFFWGWPRWKSFSLRVSESQVPGPLNSDSFRHEINRHSGTHRFPPIALHIHNHTLFGIYH